MDFNPEELKLIELSLHKYIVAGYCGPIKELSQIKSLRERITSFLKKDKTLPVYESKDSEDKPETD